MREVRDNEMGLYIVTNIIVLYYCAIPAIVVDHTSQFSQDFVCHVSLPRCSARHLPCGKPRRRRVAHPPSVAYGKTRSMLGLPNVVVFALRCTDLSTSVAGCVLTAVALALCDV